MEPTYEDYRRTQIEDGLLFQDFVVDLAWKAGLVIAQYASKTYQITIGESRSGVEIKHDKKMKTTGMIYLETAEKARPRPGPYVPSGIMREGHWLYAIGDYDTVFFFPNNFLRSLYEAKNGKGAPLFRRVETPTSQAFLLPLREGRKYAAIILEPMAGDKVSQMTNDLELRATELRSILAKNQDQLSLFE